MKIIFFSLIVSFCLIFTGCGGEDESANDTAQTSTQSSSVTGTFVDDPVEGLGYRCDLAQQKQTTVNGNFTCEAGESVRFNIGEIVLPTISAQNSIITPYSLYPNDIEAALNLAQLLQTLDADGLENNNHILVDKDLQSRLHSDISIEGSDFKSKVEEALTKVLKNRDEVKQKLNNNLEDLGIDVPQTGADNHMPIADAGAAQNVKTGSSVKLSAVASSDADGDQLRYAWTLSSPAGSSASLDNAMLVNPSFYADVEGVYTASLVVSDAEQSSLVSTVKITASTDNSAPVANAGADQGVNTTNTAFLDAQASTDADGDSLTYRWTLLQKPSSSTTSVLNADKKNASLYADKDGQYIVRLVVNDGKVSSSADEVIITASTANVAPVANAGVDKSLILSQSITLNGLGSSDANSDSLTYSWSIISAPQGSQSKLSDATVVKPTFKADLEGSYVFQLIVNDGSLNSTADTVRLSVSSVAPDSIEVSLSSKSLSGVAPFNVNFTSNASGGSGQYTYIWTSGDGEVVDLAGSSSFSHTYTKVGDYALKLKVSDENGLSKIVSKTVSVKSSDYTPLVNNFTIESSTRMPLLSSEYYDNPLPDAEFLRLSKEHRSINSAERVLTGNGYIYAGETYDIRILVAPGIETLSMHGTSNNWNVTAGYAQPMFAQYLSKSVEPFEFCQSATQENCFDSTKLRTSQGQFPLPATQRSETAYPIDEPFYVHFIIEVPSNGSRFSMATLSIQELALNKENVEIYTNWLSNRPWAGGPASNSIDGLDASDISSDTGSDNNDASSKTEIKENLSTWDNVAQLNIDSSVFTEAPIGSDKFTINTAVMFGGYVYRGYDFILKVLVPPGTQSVRISAQSNNWQCAPDILDAAGNVLVSTWDRCPRMDGFKDYPGNICQAYPTAENPIPCGNGDYVYPSDLHLVTARLGDELYNTDNNQEIVQNPQYSYFILYQAKDALSSFRAGTYALTYSITDLEKYNNWRANRPWAGGPASNSIDGLDATDTNNNNVDDSGTTDDTESSTALNIDALNISTGSEALSIDVAASVSGGEGKNLVYEWDFGDGTSNNIYSKQTSHTYKQSGNYEVSVKVWIYGESKKVSKTQMVRVD